jgi:hypothetical protein
VDDVEGFIRRIATGTDQMDRDLRDLLGD